jgi:hypothetical protein
MSYIFVSNVFAHIHMAPLILRPIYHVFNDDGGYCWILGNPTFDPVNGWFCIQRFVAGRDRWLITHSDWDPDIDVQHAWYITNDPDGSWTMQVIDIDGVIIHVFQYRFMLENNQLVMQPNHGI